MKKIKFIPVSLTNDPIEHPVEKFLEPPSSTKKHIPDWYKKGESFTGGKPFVENYSSNADMKTCMPFLDAFTTGYVVTLWTDITVEKDENGQTLKWLRVPNPIGRRPEGFGKNLSVPFGHSPIQYSWNIPWAFKTPKEYSLLFTHPLNRSDLPFISLSGIVDTDKFFSGGQYPFFLREDFEGIIPVGTPLIQIIPIKRDNWKSEVDASLRDEAQKNGWVTRSFVSGYYKKTRWQKKLYE